MDRADDRKSKPVLTRSRPLANQDRLRLQDPPASGTGRAWGESRDVGLHLRCGAHAARQGPSRRVAGGCDAGAPGGPAGRRPGRTQRARRRQGRRAPDPGLRHPGGPPGGTHRPGRAGSGRPARQPAGGDDQQFLRLGTERPGRRRAARRHRRSGTGPGRRRGEHVPGRLHDRQRRLLQRYADRRTDGLGPAGAGRRPCGDPGRPVASRPRRGHPALAPPGRRGLGRRALCRPSNPGEGRRRFHRPGPGRECPRLRRRRDPGPSRPGLRPGRRAGLRRDPVVAQAGLRRGQARAHSGPLPAHRRWRGSVAGGLGSRRQAAGPEAGRPHSQCRRGRR